MTKLFVLLLIVWAGIGIQMAYAAANNMVYSQRNASDTGYITWVFPTPSGPTLLLYDTSDNKPHDALIGPGFSWDGTTLSVPTTTRTFNYPTRSLNSCFQPSASKDALVSYSVDIQTSLSLTTGQQGTVYLRTYTNSGCSTGTQEIARFVNGQTGTLTIGLALQQNVTGTLTGMIPAGAYAQLVTENNTGTPTFTYRSAQEVLQ